MKVRWYINPWTAKAVAKSPSLEAPGNEEEQFATALMEAWETSFVIPPGITHLTVHGIKTEFGPYGPYVETDGWPTTYPDYIGLGLVDKIEIMDEFSAFVRKPGTFETDGASACLDRYVAQGGLVPEPYRLTVSGGDLKEVQRLYTLILNKDNTRTETYRQETWDK